MSELYDADILSWSEQQSELLRRLAAGERVNDAELDWPNIIEEIESVGRSDLYAVESLLTNALAHYLKLISWPNTNAVRAWEKELRVFRRQARRRFAPSMRQKIDLAQLYADARDLQPEAIDGQPPLPILDACPVTLDELLSDK